MPPEDLVHQLIYVSAAREPFSAPALALLLLKARENNRRLGVSGLLVHKDGSFFQVLEGNKDVVESLFALISRDKRHDRSVVLVRGSAPRAFSQWSMGFVAAEDVTRMPGFVDFFKTGLNGDVDEQKATRARSMALAFREGRFRQFVDGR